MENFYEEWGFGSGETRKSAAISVLNKNLPKEKDQNKA